MKEGINIMNFTFENQGTNTYLVYSVRPNDDIDTMSLGMITNNKIPGLATTIFTQVDTVKYIKYNVSAHVSAKQFFSVPINKKRLLAVFKGIVNAMMSAEEYMLDSNSIIMNMDYIFTDVSTCETILICLPVIDAQQNDVDLGTFFKNIVVNAQFDRTENCDYIIPILNYLNSTPHFSLTDFKAILDSAENNGHPAMPAQPPQQPVVNQNLNVKHVPHTIPVQSGQPVAKQPIVQQQMPPKQQFVKAPPSVPNVPPKSQNIPNKAAVPTMGKMNVPGQKSANNAAIKQTANNGEKMSLFYLLQHYNKENAAAYKAQKEANKNGTNSAPVANSAKGNKRMSNSAPQTFTVPGAPVQQNNNFAVPGQAAQRPMAQQRGNVPPQAQRQPINPPASSQHQMQRPPMMNPQMGNQPQMQRPQATVNQQPVNQVPFNNPPMRQPMNANPPVMQQNQGGFGETTVLGGSGMIGETTVLNQGQSAVKVEPYIVRLKNNERIPLNKPVFRIGKEKSYVDYFILDNTAISRSHANIITRDGEYFIVDTNSTNHTYVNGAMIQSNVEVKLEHNAKIRLANEEFEFKTF